MKLIRKISSKLGCMLSRVGQGTAFPADPFKAQSQIIYSLNQNNITIFDVGANKGQTARKYRTMFPDADIYCFEPFPDSINNLLKQFTDDKNIHIVPKAIGKENGVSTFYVNEYDPTNSLLPRPISGRRYYPQFAGPKETIEVKVVDIDGFMLINNISKIDILKFDIQGGELNALHGAKKLLESGNTSLIYTEIMFIPHYEGGSLFYEIWSFLSSYGYSLFDIYDLHRATNGQIRYGDALFINESIRDNVINKYMDEP